MKPRKIALDNVLIESHPDLIPEKLFHFSVVDPESNAQGFGTDKDKSLALKKAFNEMVERFYFFENRNSYGLSSTSGLAAHDSFKLAATSATSELIERDAFFTCWLKKECPKWLFNTSEFERPKEFANFDWDIFTQFNFVCKIGLLAVSGDYNCLVGIIKGPDFGGIFSSASSIKFNEALTSVYNELRRAAIVVQNRRARAGSLWEDISEEDVKTTADHLEFYMNPNNFSKIDWFLETREEQLILPLLDVETINFDQKIQSSWPIFVSLARSKQAQNFYVGQTTDEKINYRKFFGETNLNKELHPLP